MRYYVITVMKSQSSRSGNDLKSREQSPPRKRCKLTHESKHMIEEKKIVVVMPAYNAEKTLEKTFNEIPFDIVDEVIVVDDHSRDNTLAEAGKLGIQHVIVHEKNKG